MIDPISIALGAALVLAGFVLGKVNRRKPISADPTICVGCGHSLTYRDPATGACTAVEVTQTSVFVNGDLDHYEDVLCNCKNHVNAEQMTIDATWQGQLRITRPNES